MTVMPRWTRKLSRREIWWLIMIAIGLHVLPLILADYPYLDDAWRAMQAGRDHGAYDSWSLQGRVLMSWLHACLSFSNASLDLFPLPLLVVIPLVAWSFCALVQHLFKAPSLAAVLVVLPLWFNPFFLQNLSYQFDAPGMALSLAACAWAISLGVEQWKCRLMGLALVTVALSFYQVSVNVFASLACVEIVNQFSDRGHLRLAHLVRLSAVRLLQVAGGCVLYYLTAFQLTNGERTMLQPLDSRWAPEMLGRLEVAAGHLRLLVTPETLWLFVGWSVLAALGFGLALYRVANSDQRLYEKLGLVIVLCLAVTASAVLISGIALLFQFYDEGARLLMGLGPALVMLGVLTYQLLETFDRRTTWLLAFPLLFMVSFSFAYGRVLILQKQLEQQVSSELAFAIQLHPQAQAAKQFIISGIDKNEGWIPAAVSGSYAVMPALRYVLNIRWMILSESMKRFGVGHFVLDERMDAEAIKLLNLEPVIDAKLFSIYLAGEVGYVLMKPMPRETLAP